MDRKPLARVIYENLREPRGFFSSVQRQHLPLSPSQAVFIWLRAPRAGITPATFAGCGLSHRSGDCPPPQEFPAFPTALNCRRRMENGMNSVPGATIAIAVTPRDAHDAIDVDHQLDAAPTAIGTE